MTDSFQASAAPGTSGLEPSFGRDAPERPLLRIAAERRGAGWVIQVGGDIDISTSPQLRCALDDAIDGSRGQVIIDLSAVDFIDISGLRVLLSAIHHAGPRDFAVTNPSATVRRLLKLTGVELPTPF
jgi:anti-sigma B factor antagonist